MTVVFFLTVYLSILYGSVSCHFNFERTITDNNHSFTSDKYILGTASELTCSLVCALNSECIAIQMNKELALCELVNVTDHPGSLSYKLLNDAGGLHVGVPVDVWTKTATAISCGIGWQSFGNSCYIEVNVNRTFDKAMSNCQDLGGHLVFIKSAQVQNFVEATLLNGVSVFNKYWIGLRALQNTEDHYWLDHSPLQYFGKWHLSRPDHLGELCVQLVVNWGHSWDDCFCTVELMSICEKP